MMDPQVAAEYEEYKEAGRIWGVIDKENIKKIKFPRVPKEIVEGFKALAVFCFSQDPRPGRRSH